MGNFWFLFDQVAAMFAHQMKTSLAHRGGHVKTMKIKTCVCLCLSLSHHALCRDSFYERMEAEKDSPTRHTLAHVSSSPTKSRLGM